MSAFSALIEASTLKPEGARELIDALKQRGYVIAPARPTDEMTAAAQLQVDFELSLKLNGRPLQTKKTAGRAPVSPAAIYEAMLDAWSET